MRLCSLCAAIVVWSSICATVVDAQAQQAPPPPGTAVEVLDGAGRLQAADFVEMTPSGQVKVKLNGETRTFPATRVRLANGGRNSSSSRPSSSGSTPKVAESPEAAAAAAKLAGMRTWTDSTGTFKVDAEFVSFKNGTLELRKADGKVIKLTTDKLSAGDQEIARFLASRPGQGNPFEEQIDDPGIVIAVANVRTATVSHDAAPKIDLTAAVDWTGTPDPAKKFIPLPPTSLKVKRISGSKYNFGRETASDSIVLDVANQRAWIGVSSKVWTGGGNQPIYRLEIIDFRAGGSVIPIAMPAHCRPESVDPSGRLLVTRTGQPELDATATAQLDIWQLNGAGLRHSRSFIPASSANGNVVWARFVDTTHLLTRNFDDQLVLWNIEKQQPVYQTAPGTARTCELSPGGTHVAIAGGRSAYLLEALTGKVLGKLGSKEPEPLLTTKPSDTAYDFLRIGFSVDGGYIAAAASHAAFAWKVKDGECLHALSSRLRIVPGDETRACLSFGAYQTLIIDHEFVFDTKQRKTIYDLNGNWKAAAQYAGKELYVFDEFWDEQALTSFLLPTDRMAADAAARTISNSLAAIDPGTTVNMRFQLPFDDKENDQIKAHFTAQLKALGLRIVPDDEKGILEFIAQVTAKDEETSFQFPDGTTQSRTGPRFTGLISIGKPGVPPHQTTMTSWGAPGKVYLQRGDTPEGYAPSVPTAEFFLKTLLTPKPGEVPAMTHYSLPRDGSRY